MNSQKLYQKLDNDFDLDKCQDDWSEMAPSQFISETFKTRHMGLVLDNTDKIEKVYAAVFPSDKVLDYLLEKNEKDLLLFTHHPMTWDTKTKGFPFLNISQDYQKRLKENRISLYTLHVPLDKNGHYSTSVSLAKAIGVSYEEDFALYYGVQVGVLGRCGSNTVNELAQTVESAVGHRVGVLRYGVDDISNQTIAVVAGGGNDLDIMEELIENNIKTYVTGVIKPINSYPPSVEFDRLARENKINIIGATHYSTEKFACLAMLEYFKSLDLPTEFILDMPDFGDIE